MRAMRVAHHCDAHSSHARADESLRWLALKSLARHNVDLFERYSLDDADGESLPVPCRFVTFAARYAEPVRRELERLGPSLVVYDTFAVIGRVVARSLSLFYGVEVIANGAVIATSNS